MANVLLTGISGFLGSHTAIQLLQKGYSVKGTLRDIKRAESVKKIIGQHVSVENLSFVQADLADKRIWDELIRDIDYVQHVASPFPRELPKTEDDLIIPAREGTLAILQAASKHGVKRVVLTSSTAAMVYGKEHAQRSGTYNETHWTDFTNKSDTTPYFRSKTIAERAAWEFIKHDQSGLELSVVCPGAILGPVLEEDFGTSANIVLKLLDGSMPAMPKIGFDAVDVRSVASLLMLAMEKPEAASQRYAGSTGFLTFTDVSAFLREAYPKRKIPKRTLPDFFIRLLARFDKTLGPVLLDLNSQRRVDHSKARKELGWQPRSNKEAVLSCAESLISLGLVK